MYGWMGTVLQVDLSSGKIEKQPLSDELRLKYLGGRGINSRILYDSVGPGVEPLGPDNVLVFGTGTMTGTIAPSSGRLQVSAKSPLTGILGDGNTGGDFSLELKRAGYDHIVIRGKAESPVYLMIDNDRIELRPAGGLWGKGTQATEDDIRRELRNSQIKIASIGQGGENLVRFAKVIFDSYHAAARPGMGAVMGSKNLKAVAVKGTKAVQVANPEAFTRLSQELVQRIVDSRAYKGAAYYGTPHLLMFLYQQGWQPCKNSQTYEWPEIYKIHHRVLRRDYFIKELSCTACPHHCNQAWLLKEGPYAGLQGGKIEYTSMAVLGCGCLIADFGAIAKMTDLCDNYSLDIMELGNILNAAMEWYEKGLITKDDTDGIDLSWGNAEGAIQIIHKVATREGFGNLLAEGAVRAAQAIGKGAENYISTYSKGMSQGTQDVRPCKGYALGAATSTRGADHLRGMAGYEEIPELTTPEIAKERFGTEEACIPGSYKKAPLVIWDQNLCVLADSLGICKFNTEHSWEAITIKDMADLFSLATGVDMNEETMWTAANRLYTVEKAFLVREGLRRKDDALAGKWGNEPVPDGPCKGERIDPEKFSKLLDEYYQLRGWDEEGIPTSVTLSALGLENIDPEMQQARLTGT